MSGKKTFLCYARRDEEKVKELYSRLKEAKLDPWMDKKNLLPGENWDQSIRDAIRKSDYFLVILTKNAVDKRGYLQKEIKQALNIHEEKLDEDRYIIPVRIDNCKIPDRLNHLHCADLFEKDGFDNLIKSIHNVTDTYKDEDRLQNQESIDRVTQLPIGGLESPCFFPSISSVAKNTLSPVEHLKILVGMRYPMFLISAFDIFNAKRDEHLKMYRLLEKASTNGQVILMDSGIFEKKWARAKSWPKKNFQQTLKQTPCHLAFCYDKPRPSENNATVVSDIVKTVNSNKKGADFNAIVPIVHAQNPEDFSQICGEVALQINSDFIAVPERELGNGLLARRLSENSIVGKQPL